MSANTHVDDLAAWAQGHEVPWTRDPAAEPARWGIHHDDPPPYNRLFGPVHARGGVSGVVWQRGRELAAFGEPERADVCFSVAKSVLALLAGVAQHLGLLPAIDEPVARRCKAPGFEGPHNSRITWRHLLQQTSEWEGVCFGISDTADRWRQVAMAPVPVGQGRKGDARPLHAPGSYWEYNDVRINQLALALMHLFGRPLPDVLRECLLAPLGASSDWAWRGYDDAWADVKGQRMHSVPGGSHWGGGLSIGTRDLARLGQLLLDDGNHQGQRLLPAGWAAAMAAPCELAPFYGLLMWLNPQGKAFAQASPQASLMVGAGGHTVWLEPELQMVAVVRWLDAPALGGWMQRVRRVVEGGGG